eukprot:scaffold303692_cov26-Tisochrysis_lutea.AAC.1
MGSCCCRGELLRPDIGKRRRHYLKGELTAEGYIGIGVVGLERSNSQVDPARIDIGVEPDGAVVVGTPRPHAAKAVEARRHVVEVAAGEEVEGELELGVHRALHGCGEVGVRGGRAVRGRVPGRGGWEGGIHSSCTHSNCRRRLGARGSRVWRASRRRVQRADSLSTNT